MFDHIRKSGLSTEEFLDQFLCRKCRKEKRETEVKQVANYFPKQEEFKSHKVASHEKVDVCYYPNRYFDGGKYCDDCNCYEECGCLTKRRSKHYEKA